MATGEGNRVEDEAEAVPGGLTRASCSSSSQPPGGALLVEDDEEEVDEEGAFTRALSSSEEVGLRSESWSSDASII